MVSREDVAAAFKAAAEACGVRGEELADLLAFLGFQMSKEELAFFPMGADHETIIKFVRSGFRSKEAAAAPPRRELSALSVLTAVTISDRPLWLAAASNWHPFAFTSSSPLGLVAPNSKGEEPAFFGFRPCAAPPACIPSELVSPALRHIPEAVAAPSEPSTSIGNTDSSRMYGAVLELLKLGSALYSNEADRQAAFLHWHDRVFPELGEIRLPQPSAQQLPANVMQHGGMLTYRGREQQVFAVVLLECEHDVGSAQPLVQALRYYQMHYEDGKRWANDLVCRAHPLPALLLLLEGPRLSIHAAWTIYQNRVGYAPLTPSYYLANAAHDSASLWKLTAVLAAYERTVQELLAEYASHAELGAGELERAAALRTNANTVLVVPPEGGQPQVAARPSTLPYCLLDPPLGLYAIAYHGVAQHNALLYEARQRLQQQQQQLEGGGGGDGGGGGGGGGGGCGEDRHVLVKFVEGRYGGQVHEAWHRAGVAPALYHWHLLPGRSRYHMVVMQRLRREDGWMPLAEALAACDGGGGSSAGSAAAGGGGAGREAIRQAVRAALQVAHAAPLARSAAAELLAQPWGLQGGSAGAFISSSVGDPSQPGAGGAGSGGTARGRKTVHGDMRRPNIMVRWLNDDVHPTAGAAGCSSSTGAQAQSDLAAGSSRDAQVAGGGGGCSEGGAAAAAAQVQVHFIDFDWAGIEGDETCRYPLLLSPHIVWPAGVVPGGEMRQQHDTDMLEMELQRTR
ncbi:hypothetical protein CHLRE_12g539850v5 [Chlamydomonas reinhardtii]|uniref:Uncharacterized protein n=1 Tax=Chlamydomonas reinhardtii TaxID=3055 RepID=A0A2K3D700_CHLRE|nr:uncharacterized protein CHLRE_12g539850v5 [Chlamydomonas reinhardtii]PNW76304.1 hypothetical protein CHLRE_12g539850v5 [Chlamydomonas reinhardtii]